jgi:uncharacterized protein (TIGR00106 family)
MAVVEVSITPLGTAGTGLSQYVAGCVDIVRRSGIKHQLTPMGTVLEGNLDEIWGLIREMQEATFHAGVTRVSTLIKIDDRRDRPHTMADKLASVEKRLER